MDFCTCNRFILFKTNELLEKHPNYLDMALSKALTISTVTVTLILIHTIKIHIQCRQFGK